MKETILSYILVLFFISCSEKTEPDKVLNEVVLRSKIDRLNVSMDEVWFRITTNSMSRFELSGCCNESDTITAEGEIADLGLFTSTGDTLLFFERGVHFRRPKSFCALPFMGTECAVVFDTVIGNQQIGKFNMFKLKETNCSGYPTETYYVQGVGYIYSYTRNTGKEFVLYKCPLLSPDQLTYLINIANNFTHKFELTN